MSVGATTPTCLIPPSDPRHFKVRRVSTAGTFRLYHGHQFFTQAYNGEMIGLEEVQDRLWNVFYYSTLPDHFDERTRTIIGEPSLKNDCSRCPPTKIQRSSRLFKAISSRWR